MKRIISLMAALLLLLSACAPAKSPINREERLRFFEFADAYRLDLLSDFEDGKVPQVLQGEGAPFVELIDYREEQKGDHTRIIARYVAYSFPELQMQPEPKNHPHYEWAKDTVVNGETEGFNVEAVVDLVFTVDEGQTPQLFSKKTLE